MKISPCNLFDLNQILLLETENFFNPYTKDMIKNMLTKENSLLFKIEQDENIIGYIATELILDEAELIKIVIKKEFRRQKLASKLLNHTIIELKSKQISKIFLEVDESNHTAISFYKINEFSIIAVREKYYCDRSAVIMQKNLN